MFSKRIKTIVKIEGMSCEHCANKVKNTLQGINNIKSVKVNLSKKIATITSSNTLDKDMIKNLIEDLDYKLIDIVEE